MTVLFEKVYLTGLIFTYANGETEEFFGDGTTGHGPVRRVDLEINEGEYIVGATVKVCAHYMRGIGFTVMRLN